jgi:hypothetical protein
VLLYLLLLPKHLRLLKIEIIKWSMKKVYVLEQIVVVVKVMSEIFFKDEVG